MADFLRRLVKEEEGASMVEYGLLIAGIAVVVMAVVFTLGGQIQILFQSVVTRLGNPTP
jgi:pilus assembly protein Flp/PilA